VRAENARFNYTDLNAEAEKAMYEETVKKIKIFGSDNRY
jgi:hypothetical protein